MLPFWGCARETIKNKELRFDGFPNDFIRAVTSVGID